MEIPKEILAPPDGPREDMVSLPLYHNTMNIAPLYYILYFNFVYVGYEGHLNMT